jgi:uncharacterized protein DUF2523
MQQILFIVAGWLIREVVIKSVVIAAMYAVLVIIVPIAIGFVTPYVGTGNLTSLFGSVPDAIYFFFYFFRLDAGLPMCISACVARFLIRRLPIIG